MSTPPPRSCTLPDGTPHCHRWRREDCLLVRFFRLRTQTITIPDPEAVCAWIAAGQPRPAPTFPTITTQLQDVTARPWIEPTFLVDGCDFGEGERTLARAHAAADHLEGRGPGDCPAFVARTHPDDLPPEPDPRELARRAWQRAREAL